MRLRTSDIFVLTVSTKPSWEPMIFPSEEGSSIPLTE